jgi:hypothetical protein
MIGQVIVQAIGGLIQSGLQGFVTDRIQTNRILFVEVPNSGKGVDSASFSLIATGTFSGLGTWQFGMNLGLMPTNLFVPPTGIAIAAHNYVTSDANNHGYTFECDVTVTNGVPSASSPWTLSIDQAVVASGICSNFPLVPNPVGPTNGANTVSALLLRTVAFSFNALYVGSGINSAIATIQVAEAGYGANMPITTINNSRNWIINPNT